MLVLRLAFWSFIGWQIAQPDATPLPPPIERDAAWDEAFTRAQGWNAGDISHSIDLQNGRTLWLFGDSIVGPVRNGSRVGGESKFVRAAIGWHGTPRDGSPGREITFGVREDLEHVERAAWIDPDAELWPDGTWYWLMGDGARVPNQGGEDRFVLFAAALGRSGSPDGMWDFRQIGGVIFEIENPDDPPSAWRATQKRNLLTTEAPVHGEPWRTTESWGLVVVEWDEPGEIGEPGARTLYIFGERSVAPGQHHLLVARCAEPDLADPNAWRFYDGESWSSNAVDAEAIATGVMGEMTIQPIERDGQRQLVLIQSEPIFGRHVLARCALAPEGPWSEPKRLHKVRELDTDDRLMTYAAKGHAHLSRPGELLVSYMINSRDFGQIFRDASLYRPRFLRVPHEELPMVTPARR